MYKIVLIIFSAIALTGCSANTTSTLQEKAPRDTHIAQENSLLNYQKEVSPGIEEIKYFFDTIESSYILLYKIDPKKYTINIENDSVDPKTISGWREKLPSSTLIINGAYFNKNYSPTGLVMIDGVLQGKTTFDYNKSGVITLSPNVDIIDTSKKNTFIEKNTSDALQSFPFLIQNSKSVIKTDSGKTARRSFMGKDIEGNIYLGVIPDYFVSLKEASEHLLKLENIQWESVINLDGGTSTGIIFSEKENNTINSYVSVPSVIHVTRK